jgi:hypothetical protein
MGAKTSLLFYSTRNAMEVLRSNPKLDRGKARRLVARLYPSAAIDEVGDGDLEANANPPSGFAYIGCFPGLTVIATSDVAVDRPSQLDRRFVDAADGAAVMLHAMHSVNDWFAYGLWTEGEPTRLLSLSPDSGIIENIGAALEFEEPYWFGEHPVDDYPLPFHPLELGEEALRALLGFNYEGYILDDDPALASITLAGFRVS